jgi:TonB family protein
MEIVVTRDGCVRNLRVRNNAGAAFAYEALWATSKWKYEPAMKDGKPVAVYITVVVDFKLH